MAKHKKKIEVLTNSQRKRLAICSDYEKMKKEKSDKGVSKYTLNYMLNELSNKYFLDERTIYNIIKRNQ